MQHPASRNTIHLEQATVLSQQAFAGAQYILRLNSPLTAAAAKPGSFVHLRCDDNLPMRRPMSIMRADPANGWIDILYKAHGLGSRMLARRQAGDQISLLGPIGVPFRLTGYRKFPLLIGGGVGIPPMVYLAEHMKKTAPDSKPLLLAGSEIPFPFTPVPSKILIDGMPEGVIATMPLMEDWGIACRLASGQGFSGCFHGFVTDLARAWLSARDNLDEIEIFSCGPTPMLRAVAKVAADFNVPCQVSLEEHMACAVGGCAGCTVEVRTGNERAMKRVCVDGPVFEASTVFF